MNHFIDAFKNYANFNGRATRTQYWMFTLFYIVGVLAMTAVDKLAGTVSFRSLYFLLLTIPSLSISARRLHDIGKSGWLQLLCLIPFVGSFVLLYFYVQPSDADNQYGAAALNTQSAQDQEAQTVEAVATSIAPQKNTSTD